MSTSTSARTDPTRRRTPTATTAIAATTALLVLLAGCVGPLGGAADGGTDTPAATGDGEGDATAADGPTITTSGAGEATAAADLAVVTVAVAHTADTAEAARADVAERTDALVAALAEDGIGAGGDDDAVSTVSYRLLPEYDHSRDGDRELLGYRAVHTLAVEVAPDRAGAVVDLAVGEAGAEVGSVAFTLTDATRADLRTEAVTDAVENARADADAVAAASGLSVVGVASASTAGGASAPYEHVRYAESADAGGAGMSFQPGPVTVGATVTITYEAE
jgi:hypothetical protein